MIDTGKFQLASQKYRLEEPIEVDGNKTSLIVEVVFNHLDGTFRIPSRLSTKTVSRNPGQNEAVKQLKNRMEDEAKTLCLALEYEWKVSVGEINPDQGDLFSTPKERYEKSVDQAMLDEHGITWDEERGYLNPDGTPFNPRAVDSDGGSDDEHNPEERNYTVSTSDSIDGPWKEIDPKLTFDAPPKEARPRKPRSNAAPVEV